MHSLLSWGGRCLVGPDEVPGTSGSSRVETLVIIDAEALRRGTTEGDELCEIEGIGPVSVEAATDLLGEGALRYLIKEGVDIKTVTKSSRTIAKAVDVRLDRPGPDLLCPGLWQASGAPT